MSRIVRQPNYKDIDLDFIPHPTTKDVVKKIGFDSIKRSIRNLVLTNYYDRKFRHYIGSNATKILFDNINVFTAQFLKDAITEVIVNFEPRGQLFDVDGNNGVLVTINPDMNGYDVSIYFTERNTGTPQQITLFLERLR